MIDIALAAAEKINAAVINARVIKPLDKDMLKRFCGAKIITIEENTLCGGFGSAVLNFYSELSACEKTAMPKIKTLGLKDEFICCDSVENQLKQNGLTPENVISIAEKM